MIAAFESNPFSAIILLGFCIIHSHILVQHIHNVPDHQSQCSSGDKPLLPHIYKVQDLTVSRPYRHTDTLMLILGVARECRHCVTVAVVRAKNFGTTRWPYSTSYAPPLDCELFSFRFPLPIILRRRSSLLVTVNKATG
jgi:hypothetical protein